MDTFYSLFRTRKGLIGAGIFLILVLSAIFIIARGHRKTTVDPEFSKYIESYTTGIISKTSTIKIRLASEVQVTHEQNGALSDNVFSFSPSIKGKAYWIDARTIEFRPEGKLDPDKGYSAEFKLGKVITVESKFKTFKFSFQTIKPDFTITFNGLQTATSTSLDKMKLTGVIQTADNEESVKVEKLLSANFVNPITISWEHNPVAKTHRFVVTQLTRGNGTINKLTLNWDGSSLDINKQGNQSFDIPAIGDFRVLDVRAVQDNDQYVLVQFSDNILVGQDLTGLISLSNTTSSAYTIEGSQVKVYGAEQFRVTTR